jgi:hypothetical protein
MNEILTWATAAYMMLGIFFLVATESLEALTKGWIDTIDGPGRDFLGVTIGLLYLFAVVQIVVFWVGWPFVVWHAVAWRSARRRRTP